MGIEIDGLDELEDALDEMLGDVLKLGEINEIPFTALFPPEFMRLYSNFDSIEHFFESSPWEVESQQDFLDIPQDPFDDYVANFTDFPDWQTMQKTAFNRYIERQIS